MTDSEDKKPRDSQESQTIRIEMPASAFEGMCRMMSQFCGSGASGSSCCPSPQEQCCADSEAAGSREFTFVLKRKE